MGKRGPPKTPTPILRLRGSWRADTRKHEPKIDPAIPPMPAEFKKRKMAVARRAWETLVPILRGMGILTKADANALARYCQLLARWAECTEFVQSRGSVYPRKNYHGKVVGFQEFPESMELRQLAGHLLRLEQQFGLTPAARASIEVARDEEKNTDEARFFGGAAG